MGIRTSILTIFVAALLSSSLISLGRTALQDGESAEFTPMLASYTAE